MQIEDVRSEQAMQLYLCFKGQEEKTKASKQAAILTLLAFFSPAAPTAGAARQELAPASFAAEGGDASRAAVCLCCAPACM